MLLDFRYLSLFELPATAGQATATVTGVITQGEDYTGVFGPPNTDLTGKGFTVVYTIDDSFIPTTFTGSPPHHASRSLSSATANPITSATMTIGGVTVSSNSHPVGSSFSGISQENPTTNTSISDTVSYTAGTAEGGFTIVTRVYYDAPPFFPSYNWETPVDYASSDTSGLALEFGYGFDSAIDPAAYQRVGTLDGINNILHADGAGHARAGERVGEQFRMQQLPEADVGPGRRDRRDVRSRRRQAAHLHRAGRSECGGRRSDQHGGRQPVPARDGFRGRGPYASVLHALL